jgi:hypothetical protein
VRGSDSAPYKVLTSVALQQVLSVIYARFIFDSVLAGNCVFSC